jgi:hypothetical protein
LIDDHAAERLSVSERAAFQQNFLVTAARQKKLEVSAALQKRLTNDLVPQWAYSLAKPAFPWPNVAWKISFGILALAVVLVSVIVIRKEPQIVRKVIPKRWRPVAVATPTPQAAHHATSSSESPVHRDEPPPLPAHEASPQTMVLRANMTTDDAPIVDLANNAAKAVRLELMLERKESATFSAVVATSSGEIVYDVREINAQDTDRLDLDVPIERLKAGNFQVTLTRVARDSGVIGTYYFRAE